jgi:hypothetical protein
MATVKVKPEEVRIGDIVIDRFHTVRVEQINPNSRQVYRVRHNRKHTGCWSMDKNRKVISEKFVNVFQFGQWSDRLGFIYVECAADQRVTVVR